MIALHEILVATDFSEPSDVALAYGRELARRFGARLTVLHVVDDVGARYVSYPLPVGDFPHWQAEAESAARTRLHTLLSQEDRQVLRAKTEVLVSTSPSEAIVSFARDAMPRISIIVMGTHGRGAVAHLLMGSVAERVVRSAPCPVLTVRHPQHEFVLPDALQTTART